MVQGAWRGDGSGRCAVQAARTAPDAQLEEIPIGGRAMTTTRIRFKTGTPVSEIIAALIMQGDDELIICTGRTGDRMHIGKALNSLFNVTHGPDFMSGSLSSLEELEKYYL
jgi:hypothetical protein